MLLNSQHHLQSSKSLLAKGYPWQQSLMHVAILLPLIEFPIEIFLMLWPIFKGKHNPLEL
jgi:hypothetical protein